MENFSLCVTADGDPVFENEKLVVWNSNSNCLVYFENSSEVRTFFGLPAISSNSDVPCNENDMSTAHDICLDIQSNTAGLSATDCESHVLQTSPSVQNDTVTVKTGSTQASWKNDIVVKALITEWKNHESYFQSTTMKNKKVWQMIAKKLQEENPLSVYTGQQCEDKFKDVRKNYVKIKDHNEQSGADLKTCKFYNEMEVVLGDKPVMKPVALASSLKKRQRQSVSGNNTPKSVYSSIGSQSDGESDRDCDTPKSLRKKSRVERDIEKLTIAKLEESRKREEARVVRHHERMERQDQAIQVYREMMESLLKKL